MFKLFKRNPMKGFGLKAKEMKKYNLFCSLQYGDMQYIIEEAKRLNKYCRKNKLMDRTFYVHPCAGMPSMGLLMMARRS